MIGEQLELQPVTGGNWRQRFDDWRHTPEGGHACNRFLRIAIGVKRRGKRTGAQAIIERIRWNETMKWDSGKSKYKINNNYRCHLADWAEETAPELKGFFNKRPNGRGPRAKRRIIITEN